VAAGVVVGLAVAEVITTFGDPRYGVGLHIGLLTTFLLLSAASRQARRRAFFLALAVAPLIRIVSTGMPLLTFPEICWYLLTSIPLFMAAFLIARALHLQPGMIGLRLPGWRHAPLELVTWMSGVGLGYVEWRILGSAPLVDGQNVIGLVGASAILLVCTGLVEEVLFRGLIQAMAGRLFGSMGGIVFSAAIFAVLHIGHRSVLDDLFVLCVGLYFSVVVQQTKSLLGVTLAHGTINIVLFVAMPLAMIQGS
jgi:membrane protease YdiL (CAAX protease family)